MKERSVCRNGENTLQTLDDWELVELDAIGEPGEGGAAGGDDDDDGDWTLESLDHETKAE